MWFPWGQAGSLGFKVAAELQGTLDRPAAWYFTLGWRLDSPGTASRGADRTLMPGFGPPIIPAGIAFCLAGSPGRPRTHEATLALLFGSPASLLFPIVSSGFLAG